MGSRPRPLWLPLARHCPIFEDFCAIVSRPMIVITSSGGQGAVVSWREARLPRFRSTLRRTTENDEERMLGTEESHTMSSCSNREASEGTAGKNFTKNEIEEGGGAAGLRPAGPSRLPLRGRPWQLVDGIFEDHKGSNQEWEPGTVPGHRRPPGLP